MLSADSKNLATKIKSVHARLLISHRKGNSFIISILDDTVSQTTAILLSSPETLFRIQS